MINERYLVTILLIGLSISILAGQKLNQLSIVGKATRATGEIVPQDKLDANMNQAALVSFITDLDVDMDFRPWNGAVGKITNPAMDRWNVYISPGERAIDVHAEGFKSLKVVLSSFGINSVKSGDVYHLEITGNLKTQEIPVVITCNQSGAKVIVDGVEMGSTVNKMLATKINLGERKIRIERDGFANQEISETVSQTNYSFHFDLVPVMPAVVKITSDPEGAMVTIDGNMKLGVTPLEIFYYAGTYDIRIEKRNYDTINEQITISEPKTTQNYKMTDIRATLTVKTHKTATVKLNGVDYKGGIDKLIMLSQTISFMIEQEYCETIEETYTLTKGEVKVFELYPEDIAAILTVKTHTNATVKFNGESYQGGVNNLKVKPQVLEIEVTMPKAETLKRVIVLKPKAEETIEMYPEVETGTIQVGVIPSKASIELNGNGVLFSNELEIMSFEEDRLDMHASVNIVEDSNHDHCAAIRIEHNLQSEVYITDVEVFKREKRGNNIVYFYISKWERSIIITTKNYLPYKYSFPINLKPETTYVLTLDGNSENNSSKLIPVMITSNQSGFTVLIDEKEAETTNKKNITINIGRGTHKIKIEKNGFSSQILTEGISFENNYFEVNLMKKMPAEILLTTNPSGAKVYFDKVLLGETPINSFYDEGKYSIKIEKENYELINDEIYIIEPKTEKHYSLKDIKATLTIKTHENAIVKFNNKSFKGGITNYKIKPQFLKIRVEMPKTETLERDIILKPYDEITIEMYP